MRTLHMCFDVEGALVRNRLGMWRGLFTRKDGSRPTVAEVRALLLAELAKGHRCIPIGEPCEGFSYETGCPGHVEADVP